jgi:hypothetical protein
MENPKDLNFNQNPISKFLRFSPWARCYPIAIPGRKADPSLRSG